MANRNITLSLKTLIKNILLIKDYKSSTNSLREILLNNLFTKKQYIIY